MDDKELRELEEKLSQVLVYCESLREQRRQLIGEKEALADKVNELESELGRYRADRDEIRNRVSNLLGKIEGLGELSGE